MLPKFHSFWLMARFGSPISSSYFPNFYSGHHFLYKYSQTNLQKINIIKYPVNDPTLWICWLHPWIPFNKFLYPLTSCTLTCSLSNLIWFTSDFFPRYFKDAEFFPITRYLVGSFCEESVIIAQIHPFIRVCQTVMISPCNSVIAAMLPKCDTSYGKSKMNQSFFTSVSQRMNCFSNVCQKWPIGSIIFSVMVTTWTSPYSMHFSPSLSVPGSYCPKRCLACLVLGQQELPGSWQLPCFLVWLDVPGSCCTFISLLFISTASPLAQPPICLVSSIQPE